jgi:tetratricopeptide (TPR) repeat protein
MTRIVLILMLLNQLNCATRNYTHYLIQPAPKKNPVLVEEETMLRPMAFGSNTVMKVRWNDGNMITEVELPMLASGQRIIVDHGSTNKVVKTIPATKLVPPPPSKADLALIEAYRKRGLRIDQNAVEISLARSRTLMRDALSEGNYQVALEWCELVLGRYPSHPEFLRAKASILLLLGERDSAIEIYEQVEEIESDPVVRQKLEELQKEER